MTDELNSSAAKIYTVMAAYQFGQIKTDLLGGNRYLPRKVELVSTANVNLAADVTAISIDGSTPSVGNRILLKNQSTATENGIYVVAAGAGNTIRSIDMPAGSNAASVIVLTSQGAANINTGWRCTNPIATAVVGTDNLTFVVTLSEFLNGDLIDTAVQTLTNKTIDSPTNNIVANSLATTTSPVSISAAAAPTSGQILTATSATTATWQNISGTPTGEANTASNVGTLGVGLFAQKSGVDLQFNSISLTGTAVVNTFDAGNNWLTVGVDIANYDWHQCIGPMLPAKGGTGLTSMTASRAIISNGSSAFTFKTRPPTNDLLSTDNPSAIVTNKTITDPSNTLVRVVSVLSGGTDVNLTIVATDQVGGILRSTTATAASIVIPVYPYTNFVFGVSEAESTTTSTTDTQKLQLSCNTSSSLTYLVIWYVEVFADTPSTTVNRSVTVTHSTSNTVIAGYLAQNYANYNSFFGHMVITAATTSATYPVRIFFRSGTAGVTTRVRRARLTFYKA